MHYTFSSLKDLVVLRLSLFLLPGSLLFCVGMIGSIASLLPDQLTGVLILAGMAALLIGFAAYVIAEIRAQRKNEKTFLRFAKENGLGFSTTQPVLASEPGSLFRYGWGQRISTVFSGAVEGLPYQLYSYRYTVGHGKSAQHFYATIASVGIPRAMPHMVIDSLVESGGGHPSVLPIRFAQSQKIQLEGDFSDYFSLYAPDKQAVTALTILAPDVMQTLLQKNALCDIEIIGKKVYFYWPQQTKTAADYEYVFTALADVMAQIAPPLTRMAGVRSLHTITTQPVSEPPLLKNRSSLLGLLSVFAIFIIIFLSAQYNHTILSFMPLLIPIVLLAGFAYQKLQRYTRYRRLRRRNLR